MLIQKISRLLDLKSPRSAAVAALLAVLLPRSSKAEDSVTYKHQSYQETNGRIRVESEYGQVDAQLPAEIRLKLTGVIDTITGATPTGEIDTTLTDPVVLNDMHDRRKAWHAEFSRQFQRVNVTLGYDNSHESDYLSNGLSLNTVTDFNDKNTSLTLGISGTDDDAKKYGPVEWLKKRSYDGIVGITQIINPETIFTANVSYGHGSGYMNDPYKLVQKDVEVLPELFMTQTFSENRPTSRNKWILFLGLTHDFSNLDGALDTSYRLYDDTYGVTGNTATIQWTQKLFDGRVYLTPSFRYHTQTAADFYYPNVNDTGIMPDEPASKTAPFYSSDYRLSKLDTYDVGLKLVWNVIPDRLALDVSYDRYTMKGKDGVTYASAYPNANVFNFGAKFSW